MDGEAWWATVHGVAKSRTGLSDLTFTFNFLMGLRDFLVNVYVILISGGFQHWYKTRCQVEASLCVMCIT